VRGNGPWPTFVALKEINPVVTLRGLDLAPWTSWGPNGCALTGLTLYLRRCCADAAGGFPYVPDATAAHIAFTAAAGLVAVENTGGGGNSEATTGLRVYLRGADSVTPSLAVNPASAIV